MAAAAILFLWESKIGQYCLIVRIDTYISVKYGEIFGSVVQKLEYIF